MPTQDKQCVICGKPFRTRLERVKACSQECGLKLRSQRRASRTDLPKPDPKRGSHITDQYRKTTTVACPVCGTDFEQRSDSRPETCSKPCSYTLRGQRHTEFWEKRYQDRGTLPRKAMPNGYIQVQLSPAERKERKTGTGGYVLEHRYMMEQYIGRVLERHETVHHKNGDRADNRLENLELWIGGHGPGATEAHCATCTCFGT